MLWFTLPMISMKAGSLHTFLQWLLPPLHRAARCHVSQNPPISVQHNLPLRAAGSSLLRSSQPAAAATTSKQNDNIDRSAAVGGIVLVKVYQLLFYASVRVRVLKCFL